MNDFIQSAAGYHRATEYHRRAMQGHYLDWPNQPDVYKRYSKGRVFPLPPSETIREMDLWRLSNLNSMEDGKKSVNPSLLATVFQQAYSLTASARYAGGNFHYRSVASAGALYPTELYLSAAAVSGLEAGLYHYAIANRSLVQLRQEDMTPWVGEATRTNAGKRAAATFFITGIVFRSAWKYRARAYRYVLLDAGHLMENMILALKSLSLPFSFGYDFDDKQLERIIGVDGRREVCLGWIHLQTMAADALVNPENRRDPKGNIPAAEPVSLGETAYAEIEQIHQAGSTVTDFDSSPFDSRNHFGVESSEWQMIQPVPGDPSGPKYPELVYRRRSKRNFTADPMPNAVFHGLVGLVSSALQRPETKEIVSTVALKVGLLTGDITGVSPGFYRLDPEKNRIGLVASGNKIREMAAVCLDQEWLAQATLHFLFMSDLDFLDQASGPRGYRHVMMTAGRLGQIIYLGATAHGLGCCGIGAIYDEEARKLLGLNDQSALLYLAAVGAVKRL